MRYRKEGMGLKVSSLEQGVFAASRTSKGVTRKGLSHRRNGTDVCSTEKRVRIKVSAFSWLNNMRKYRHKGSSSSVEWVILLQEYLRSMYQLIGRVTILLETHVWMRCSQ